MKKRLLFILFVTSFCLLQINSSQGAIPSRAPFLGREDLPIEIEERILSEIAGSDDFWSKSKKLSEVAFMSKGHLKEIIPSYLVSLLPSSKKAANQLFLEGLQQGTINAFGLNILKQKFTDFDAKQALTLSGTTTDKLLLETSKKGTLNPFNLKLLINLGANLNTEELGGITPLMLAAYNNHKDIVDLLLKNGADPKVRDAMGRTYKYYISY